MIEFVIGVLVGVAITTGFWLINRWYWKSMYESEKDYSQKLANLFEQNHPFRIKRTKS